MDPILLNNFPFDIDVAGLLERLHVDGETADGQVVRDMARSAKTVARPKALCGVAYVDSRDGDSLTLDGVAFQSRVLAVNLQNAHRVFPYAATCGREVEAWSSSISDMLYRYYADAIKQALVHSAVQAVRDFVQRHFQPGKTAGMNPGSLPDWPMAQQRPLFQLLGDAKGLIGVELTDSMLMLPTKSVSGILFPTENSYENCQLCPRDNCPGRRAEYDKDLFDKKYAK